MAVTGYTTRILVRVKITANTPQELFLTWLQECIPRAYYKYAVCYKTRLHYKAQIKLMDSKSFPTSVVFKRRPKSSVLFIKADKRPFKKNKNPICEWLNGELLIEPRILLRSERLRVLQEIEELKQQIQGYESENPVQGEIR